MNFITIDFETANSWNRGSACAVGIVVVKNGVIVDQYYSLINPNDEIDPYFIEIHGITQEMVKFEPTFEEVWKDIRHFFEDNIVIAHNASFDMSVLRYCLNAANITFPDFNYACTYLLAKRVYPGLPSYRLNYIFNHLNLGNFDHHNALEDSRAAALILLNYLDINDLDDVELLSNKYEYNIGRLISAGNTYRPFSAKKKARKPKGMKAIDLSTAKK